MVINTEIHKRTLGVWASETLENSVLTRVSLSNPFSPGSWNEAEEGTERVEEPEMMKQTVSTGHSRTDACNNRTCTCSNQRKF